MFSIFNKKETSSTYVEEAKKTNIQVIEEIHETFFTEVDKLLSEAKIAKSLDTDKGDLINKCNKLKALGFTTTKEVQEAEIEIDRLKALTLENEAKKDLIEAINYFSFNYPNYKFITEDSVKKICNKYGLVYGNVNRYIGTVPDRNLKHIQDFQIKPEDKAYWWSYNFGSSNPHICNLIIYNSRKKDNSYNTGEYSMKIAATIKDFNMNQSELKDFEIKDIVKEDPIVLQPVLFKDKQYYLIVTAWGPEASDELVVNHKMN